MNAADGGDPHAVEIGAGFGRVALKIAVQRTLLLRDGEFVAGLGEMVHADVQVAGLDEFEQAGAENSELHQAFGKMRDERALLFLQPGNVRVTEQRNAVRAEADDLVDRVREALRCLVRQAVNQIHVDAVEAQPPRAKK